MPKFIELDHTSSGAQIAAALTRDAEMAAMVNLTASDEQADLYTIILKDTNKAFAKMGIDWKLDRDAVKPAVIATIYGGGHSPIYEALDSATGARFKDSPEAYRAFLEIISNRMASLRMIEKYISYILKEMTKSGITDFELPLAGGASLRIDQKETEETIGEYRPRGIKPYKTIRKACQPSRNEREELRKAAEAKGDKHEAHLPLTAPKMAFEPKSVTAKVIQGFDAHLLASAKIKLAKRGIRTYAKHDAYLVPAEAQATLLEVVKATFLETFEDDHLGNLAKHLNEAHNLNLETFESFSGYGTWTPEEILDANFIIG